jgi:hypothetical protein
MYVWLLNVIYSPLVSSPLWWIPGLDVELGSGASERILWSGVADCAVLVQVLVSLLLFINLHSLRSVCMYGQQHITLYTCSSVLALIPLK